MTSPKSVHLSGETSRSSFAQIIDVTDLAARQHRLRRQLVGMRVIVTILLVAAVCVAGYPHVMQWRSDQRLESQNQSIESEVAGWPYPQAENQLRKARSYNRRLAKSGQPVLGEAVDPFSTQSGASRAGTGSEADSAASQDGGVSGFVERA